MRSSDGGFTLFEVLGAVAILAILYTTLSTVAIRALRSEGESRRMLEASLLADWELSQFELQLEAGAAPEIGITEDEEKDGFRVTWEVTPREVPIFQTASDLEGDAANAPNPAGQITPAPGQLAPTRPEAPPFLQVGLWVSWIEGGNERWVKRTIFAVDEDAASQFATSNIMRDGKFEAPEP